MDCKRKGFITLIPNVQRGIKLTQPEPVPCSRWTRRYRREETLYDEKRIVSTSPGASPRAGPRTGLLPEAVGKRHAVG